ncbi:MAG TPA: DUF2283 domain-containing protein [Anaerolineales bacterium]|nr:DUF2283 domain-containing protein [Anaerolineales bacterium]
MIVRYDRDADVLLLKLRDEPPADAVEEPGGVVISYSAEGLPISIELLNASPAASSRAPIPRLSSLASKSSKVDRQEGDPFALALRVAFLT